MYENVPEQKVIMQCYCFFFNMPFDKMNDKETKSSTILLQFKIVLILHQFGYFR